MSRGYRNGRRISSSHEEEKESFWVSYTDLMSALLVIFVLIVLITLSDTQNAFEQAQTAMAETAEAVKQKEEAIQETNKIIEDVIGVKAEIIKELLKAFQDSDLDLQVDPQTGAIRFSGGVFFNVNSSVVSATGNEYLQQFIPQYINILLSDPFRDEVAQIIVEGHTDTAGGYLFNLKLSQDRALSVVQQIFAPDFPNFQHRDQLIGVITANGRSYSMPVYQPNGDIDAEKSRRVEFKFRLKDEQVLEKLQGMVRQNVN